MTEHRFKVGDRVMFTPWFSTDEDHLTLADHDDLVMDIWGFDNKWSYFQDKYGFIPTEYYGCY